LSKIFVSAVCALALTIFGGLAATSTATPASAAVVVVKHGYHHHYHHHGYYHRHYRYHYNYRPRGWHNRGCVAVGPVWYCN
jgi:hypothetical protein